MNKQQQEERRKKREKERNKSLNTTDNTLVLHTYRHAYKACTISFSFFVKLAKKKEENLSFDNGKNKKK